MSAIFPTAVPTAAQLWTAVNGVSTTLNGAVDNLVTTLNVIDTTLFPATGYAVIDSEIIKYTGKTGTSFTGCTRGSDGSTAASHSSAATVNAYMVAAHHNDPVNEIVAIATAFGSSSQDITKTGAGKGLSVTTPDGLHTYRIAVDNNGSITTEQLT